MQLALLRMEQRWSASLLRDAQEHLKASSITAVKAMNETQIDVKVMGGRQYGTGTAATYQLPAGSPQPSLPRAGWRGAG